MSEFDKIQTYEALALTSKHALERIDNFDWFCGAMCANIVAWAYAYDKDPRDVAKAIYRSMSVQEVEIPFEGDEVE